MTDKHTQQLKQKLNKIYFEREEQIDLIIDNFTKQENLWLYGPTGTAKTALFEDIAKELGYSVHTLNNCNTLYLYLEIFDDLEKSRKLFGINPDQPAIYYLHHPYMLKEYSNLISNFLNIQQQHPKLFPFSFVVGEGLWEINNDSTRWLNKYFPIEINFECIKDEENFINFLKSKL